MPTSCGKYAAADLFITMKGLAGKGQFLGVDENKALNACYRRNPAV
jgi:hypothetical protein